MYAGDFMPTNSEMVNSISIELKRAENLKPEIRKEWRLPDTGLVIKKTKRNSPATFDYIPVSSFLGHIDKNFSQIDMSGFVKRAREVFK